MRVVINGEEVEIPRDAGTVSVAQLLALRNVEAPEMVSVQRNGEFVDRQAFATTQVGDGDEVDFLYFMGGGGGFVKGSTSRAVLGEPSGRPDAHGALRFALYDTVALEAGTAAQLEQAFAGRKPAHTCSRVTNPTVEELEGV